jgi:hypothetical protein
MVVVMESDDLLARAQSLRARGVTPKAIAKTLGITRADADALVRRIAQASATRPALVGCWVNAGWSQGLSWSDHPEWHDDGSGGDDVPDLVSVLVIREHRYDKLIACAYLVDAQCLGVKDALGPRELDRAELDGFVARQYVAYDRPPRRAPLELARELVFGAEAYARTLGFEPHRDFERCRDQLGAWSGPSQIVFGYRGKPLFIRGPHDDAVAVVDALERSVGAEDFDFVTVEPRDDVGGPGPDRSDQRRRPRSQALARRSDRSGAVPGSYSIPPVRVDVRVGSAPPDAPRGNPTSPVSDSLVRVMEPYIPWPPTPDELDELGEELSFGATVWNATTQSTDPKKTAALLEAVIGMFSTGEPRDEAALRAQVADIADRKRRLCPDDPRQIVRVDVVPRGRNVEVVAMSAWYR